MAHIEIHPALPMDAYFFAPRLRSSDVLELQATGFEPLRGLTSSYRLSTSCWSASVDGNIAAMWGCGPRNLVFGEGVVWLLTGPEVESHFVRFLRESLKWKKEMMRTYSTLRNQIDVRNKLALRWVEWLGAEFEEDIPVGNTHFRPFVMR